MTNSELIILTDSSFKRDILFEWGMFDILKRISKRTTCIDINSDPHLILDEKAIHKTDSVFVLYFINESNYELEKIIASYSDLKQFNIKFDCWAEKCPDFENVQSVSFLQIIQIIHNLSQKNVNISFINPTGWQKESTNLGLASIAGSLKMFGFSTAIFDVNRYELSDIELKNELTELNPLVIGYSAKTAVANETARLCRYLKPHLSESKMVIGGPHATLCAKDFLSENIEFDAATLSEGEMHFPKICFHYMCGLPVDDLHNTVYRKNKKIIENRFNPPENINFPFWPDYDCIRNFSWDDFRYPIITSRGCPYQCVYCCVNKLTGDRKWRYREPEHVLAELEYIKNKYNINLFEIWDDNFTLNIKRAKEICRLLIDKQLNLSWWCHNGIRADKIDIELAELMKSAGCTSIALGIETGDSKLFESIEKGESINDIINAKEIIKKAGINVVGYFILGLPGDNLQTFIKTIRFQRKLKLDHFTYGILIPYPKTKVWDTINQDGEMLIDVTRTQHFADDIVPISFNLPSFPPQDITTAYYLTKYFELFDYLDKYTKDVHVVIQLDESENNFLFGILLAVPNKANFTIKCYNVKDSLNQNQSDFIQRYFKPKIFYNNGFYEKKQKKVKEIHVISSKINSKGLFKWTPFLIFNCNDLLTPITKKFKPRIALFNYLRLGFNYLKLFYRSPRIFLNRLIHKLKVLNFYLGSLLTKLFFRLLIRKIRKLPEPKNNPEDISSFIESKNNENSTYM